MKCELFAHKFLRINFNSTTLNQETLCREPCVKTQVYSHKADAEYE